ncbi:Hsp20/alpha crystallin family protein [Myceligenerans indicum]|uniref:Hsp20/alpha crystallin family protein n=1 Tax=Myceligenerans indicum TaxID=2593663 RepID=A0ABS1LL50_9MICO|nr:Hsp20/alpha crystallin family protein [Myceligenerans indicum]MBL0886951.1 Hsp20/alpha crystallin family protein [Myceligenerans indicum]
MSLIKRESRATTPHDLFGRFDTMFDEWARSLPFRRGSGQELRWPFRDDMIRVDEYHDKDALVVRAEIPGTDPEKDVEVTVGDGMLRIFAEHEVEERDEQKGYLRRELRSGSFSRTLPLPEGVSGDDIAASCKDGILEIRIPLPETPEPAEAKRIPVAKG